MTIKLQAVFDGQVFRPLEPVSLQANTECDLTIETAPSPNEPADSEGEVYALTAIAAMAVDMGVTDLADRHHEYAHPVVKVE